MKNESLEQLEKAIRSLEATQRDLEANDPDNAIARAYYAAFHTASAALVEAEQSSRTHKGTHHLFRKIYIESGLLEASISRSFGRLFENRQEADYLIGRVFSVEEAADAIAQAREFIDAVVSLLSGPA